MERLLRSILNRMIALTIAIALAGGALVALTGRLGRWALWVGSAVVLASPWISYLVIVKVYRRKVLEAA